MKQLIKNYFSGFSYFYSQLGNKTLIAMILSIFVGILDGFGLAMFLPLLQMVDDSTNVNAEGLGNLRFLLDGMEYLGISIKLTSVLAFLCMFFILKGMAKFISEFYRVNLTQYFMSKVRLDLVSSLSSITYKAFVTSDVGRIQNTLTGEADRVIRAFQSYFRAFEQIILVFVYMCFAFFIDPKFALLVTLGGWLTNLVYKQVYVLTKRASIQLSNAGHRFEGLIIQFVQHFKYLKATGTIKKYRLSLDSSITDIEHINKKLGTYESIMQAVREPMLIIIVSAVILIQTIAWNAPLGPILISLLFFYRALSSLIMVQSFWNSYLQTSGSLINTASFQEELSTQVELNGKNDFEKLRDSLVLKSINFSYGDNQILNDVSLHIPLNETVAFVGESGSGKTTLVSMLAGLLPPDDGDYLIDGKSVRSWNIQSFQRRIGFITQDPVIFNDTIFNNVSFWEEKSVENLVKFHRAIELASMQIFLEDQADGLDTLLGNNGINLSGGQKQRISIARELYKEIDILVMDEATSALDSETEKEIQKNIEDLKGRYTILIVAHRLSTVKKADRIVLLEKGRIVAAEPFNKLIETELRFRRMVELQEV